MKKTALRFAARTDWDLEPNRLAAARERRARSGAPILDLTESNPTRCGFRYPGHEILAALGDERGLAYDPQPRGFPAARESVAAYYAERGVHVSPEQVLLTSGSSETYGFLFRLLAEPGDNVLVPHPGYPLFDFLARLHDVEQRGYGLEYHGAWEVDFGSLEAASNDRTRAVIAINPNNPTGSLLKPRERKRLAAFCAQRDIALISDEVFLDYAFGQAAAQAGSMAANEVALTFALNGLSKTAALPQLKLGWMVASGPGELVEPALARLEVIADTYLSVATPVQLAIPTLLAGCRGIQRQILARAVRNLEQLDSALSRQTLASRLEVEGGWSVVMRVPSIRSDEDWALELLENDGVLVHPGHFFNFHREGYLVVSLLVPEDVFASGVQKVLARVNER
jgi:alanine-synthesizing transaminase